MIKVISIALLAGGILLLVLGINASNVFSSDVSLVLSSAASDNAKWMLVGGVVAAVLGFMGFLRESSRG